MNSILGGNATLLCNYIIETLMFFLSIFLRWILKLGHIMILTMFLGKKTLYAFWVLCWGNRVPHWGNLLLTKTGYTIGHQITNFWNPGNLFLGIRVQFREPGYPIWKINRVPILGHRRFLVIFGLEFKNQKTR